MAEAKNNILIKVENEARIIEAKIDAWFQKLVHGTILQRDAALYNHFHAQKEDLKQQLSTPVSITPKTTETPAQSPAPEEKPAA